MRLLGCSWLADGPFPIHDSLEVKVSNQTSGHISRSEHVTKHPGVNFAFSVGITSLRPFGDICPMGTLGKEWGRSRWVGLLRTGAARAGR